MQWHGPVTRYIYNHISMYYLQNEETCQVEVTSIRPSSCVSVRNLVEILFL